MEPRRPINMNHRQQRLGVKFPISDKTLVEVVPGLECVAYIFLASLAGWDLMKRSKGCSTPYRSPGSLQTHSRHQWCHNPCHRASHSRHTPLTHSSSRNMSHHPHRSHRWHNPARCYTELGTHKRGRPEYSEHSNLEGKRQSKWVISSIKKNKNKYLLVIPLQQTEITKIVNTVKNSLIKSKSIGHDWVISSQENIFLQCQARQ